MKLRRRKGQDLPGEVILFGVAIMIAVFAFLITSNSGTIRQDIDVELDHQIVQVKKEASLSVMMEDHLWRADGINQGKYNNKLAGNVMSYYFSTSGSNYIYIGESRYPRSEVRSDIETYLSYKLDRYWANAESPVSYRLAISYDDQDISVENTGHNPDASWSGTNFKIGLTNGEMADASFEIKNDPSMYEGESRGPTVWP